MPRRQPSPASTGQAPGRIRRLIEHLEKSGLIVVRTDFGGRRSVGSELASPLLPGSLDDLIVPDIGGS